MTEIEDIKALLHQLVKEYCHLTSKPNINSNDMLETNSLEFQIIKTEAKLRIFEDF